MPTPTRRPTRIRDRGLRVCQYVGSRSLRRVTRSRSGLAFVRVFFCPPKKNKRYQRVPDRHARRDATVGMRCSMMESMRRA